MESEVSGVRVNLLIDAGLFITGLIVAVLMYADIQNLKQGQVPSDRVTRIEAKLDTIQSDVNSLRDTNQRLINVLIEDRSDRSPRRDR